MKDYPIVKKAWRVLDPTIWEEPYPQDGEIVYAETGGQAKRLCSDYSEFTNIRATRVKKCDIVEFEGKEYPRAMIEEKLKQRGRLEKVMALPDDAMFYYQDARSYVGNSVLWWGLGNSGYTTNLSNAQKYTKEEILKLMATGRHTDIVWLASHVEANIRTHVDAQYLQRDNSF